MDTGKSMLCFIAGAMAGAVAALLLAPDSGENTRAKIRKGAADMKGKAKEKIAEGLGIIEEALEFRVICSIGEYERLRDMEPR